ncbi:MAG TPA: GNAT family N-acetyltransferase [Firmicutes bacterium]|nr:GNAT family N-acetyltransferase [Bacillota bacterium]
MEIAYAAERDRPAVKEIWLSCFPGDTAETVDLFLGRLFRPGWCLVGREGNRAVTMAFLLPAELVMGENREDREDRENKEGQESRGSRESRESRMLPLRYVFAAATLPSFRGAGRFGSLLRRAHVLAKGEGAAALFLRPAEPGLAVYYERFGYWPYFMTVEDTAVLPEGRGAAGFPGRAIPPSAAPDGRHPAAENAAAFRDAALKGRPAWVRWPAEIVSLSVAGSLWMGGEGFYAAGELPARGGSSGPLFFREWVAAGPAQEALLAAAALRAAQGRTAGPVKIRRRRPAEAGEAGEPFGWLCPLTGAARALFGTAAQDRPYMGLALD